MRPLLAATSLAAVTVLAGTVAVVPPASAATGTIHDQVGDGKNGTDLKWVRVDYGAQRLRLTVKLTKGGSFADFQDFYVDTDAADHGPEASVNAATEVESWSTSTGVSWGIGSGKPRCNGKRHTVHLDVRHARLQLSLPVSCLVPRGAAQPTRIRVALAMRNEQDQTYDWAPAKRTFGPWVAWK